MWRVIMKNYIYAGVIGALGALSILLGIYVNFQSDQIAHYKNLYDETDQMLEDVLIEWYGINKNIVVNYR